MQINVNLLNYSFISCWINPLINWFNCLLNCFFLLFNQFKNIASYYYMNEQLFVSISNLIICTAHVVTLCSVFYFTFYYLFYFTFYSLLCILFHSPVHILWLSLSASLCNLLTASVMSSHCSFYSILFHYIHLYLY